MHFSQEVNMPKKIFVLFLTLAIIFSTGTISASAEELDTPAITTGAFYNVILLLWMNAKI